MCYSNNIRIQTDYCGCRQIKNIRLNLFKSVCICTLILLGSLILLSGCGEREYSQNRCLMDSYVEIKFYCADKKKAREVMDKAFKRIEEIENMASFFKKESELSKANSSAGVSAVPLSEEMEEIIEAGLQAGELTGGGFDLSIAPLLELWGFNRENKNTGQDIPSSAQIKSVLPLVNYRRITLKNGKVRFKRRGMKMDLGGIAQGYACQKVLELIKEEGLEKVLVNISGDIAASGKTWRIGVQHPRNPQQILGVLELKNQAIVTSGDYERYFEKDGVRYTHILDPRTGYPAQGCSSVTIIAPEVTLADTLATGVFVLGPVKGMELVEGLPEVEAIIVAKNGSVRLSSGLKGKFRCADKI